MAITDLVPWRRRNRDLDLVRDWDSPFSALSRRMNRLFEDIFEDFGIEPFGRWAERTGTFLPRMDVTETDKEITVTAELPGLDEKDFEVTLEQDHLIIRGEKRVEHEDKGKDYHRIERSYGSFHRAIPLPCEVEQDKVEATFKNGVLKITLPKSATAVSSRKRITVKTG